MWLIPKTCQARAGGCSVFLSSSSSLARARALSFSLAAPLLLARALSVSLQRLLSCSRARSLIRSVTRIVRPVAVVALITKKKIAIAATTFINTDIGDIYCDRKVYKTHFILHIMSMGNRKGRENTGRSSVSKWIAEEALFLSHKSRFQRP